MRYCVERFTILPKMLRSKGLSKGVPTQHSLLCTYVNTFKIFYISDTYILFHEF